MSPRRLLPLLAALSALSPALAAAKATPSSTPSKPPVTQPADVTTLDTAAAFRALRRTDAVIKHPEKATQAQLAQAARDLTLAVALEPDFDLSPWLHADMGIVLYTTAKSKRGAERTYLLERASAQFHLAALTHDIRLGQTQPGDVTDYEAASDASASLILYYCGLLEYELGRPSNALTPLDLLLEAAADHGDELERPEYVAKARALLPKVKQADEKSTQDLLRRLSR